MSLVTELDWQEVDRHGIEELLDVPNLEAVKADRDTDLLLKHFQYCLNEGGAFSLADSINTLESRSGVLQLNPLRRDELIDSLLNLESSGGDVERFTRQCELVGMMMRMILDAEKANISAALTLFEAIAENSAIVQKWHLDPLRRLKRSPYDLAGDILRRNLENACTNRSSLKNVKVFARSIEGESTGSCDKFSSSFIKFFVASGRTSF